MAALLFALVILVGGGTLALFLGRFARAATLVGAGSAIAGSLLGLGVALRVLIGPGGGAISMHRAWDVPFGSFSIEVDALSAVFLVPIFLLGALAALYGSEYFLAWRERRSLGSVWFFLNLLLASLALVVVARNGVLFLVAWESMALVSFFLVTLDDEDEDVRSAGWTFLVASHLGTTFLVALFVMLGHDSGSLDFERFAVTGTGGVAFVLALVGFGTKAGFMPLHVWLPEAHPAAPTPVSAILSGAMIKVGVYGLARTLLILPAPQAWWGCLLVGVGVLSGLFGVLQALAQSDLKRLLAYSSVENIGIIAIGLGLGVVGRATGSPVLAVLGFGAALLHVLNHSLIKGLLFLGAGAVAHAAGTRRLERLGGLWKRMPWTGACFLVGAIAICGLPPLNGFASEFLVYLGAFRADISLGPAAAMSGLAAIVGLALVGGLAAATFAKAFGIAFLGEPRSQEAARAHDVGPAMRLTLAILALGSVAAGFGAAAVIEALRPAIAPLAGLSDVATAELLGHATTPLVWIAAAGALLVGFASLVALARHGLLRRRKVSETVTWDCGFSRPTARMQYTASSFAQPLVDLFASVLRTRHRVESPVANFPRDASFATETPDACRERVYRPGFASVGWAFSKLRWVQHGRLHLYVLYIALTALTLLAWKLA